MDLKALILAKRKATAEEFQGRKYVKRSDLEAARLQKLRDEEEEERQQGKVCMPSAFAMNSVVDLLSDELLRQLAENIAFYKSCRCYGTSRCPGL